MKTYKLQMNVIQVHITSNKRNKYNFLQNIFGFVFHSLTEILVDISLTNVLSLKEYGQDFLQTLILRFKC